MVCVLVVLKRHICHGIVDLFQEIQYHLLVIFLLTRFVLFDNDNFLLGGWRFNSSFFCIFWLRGLFSCFEDVCKIAAVAAFFLSFGFFKSLFFFSLKSLLSFQLHKFENLFWSPLRNEKFLNTDLVCFLPVFIVINDDFDFIFILLRSELVFLRFFPGNLFQLLIVLVSAAERRVDNSQCQVEQKEST